MTTKKIKFREELLRMNWLNWNFLFWIDRNRPHLVAVPNRSCAVASVPEFYCFTLYWCSMNFCIFRKVFIILIFGDITGFVFSLIFVDIGTGFMPLNWKVKRKLVGGGINVWTYVESRPSRLPSALRNLTSGPFIPCPIFLPTNHVSRKEIHLVSRNSCSKDRRTNVSVYNHRKLLDWPAVPYYLEVVHTHRPTRPCVREWPMAHVLAALWLWLEVFLLSVVCMRWACISA